MRWWVGPIVALLMACATSSSEAPAAPLREVQSIRFYNSFWLNLHHTLYASVYSGRTRMAAPQGALDQGLTDAERATWRAARDYYAANLGARDLRTGENMPAIRDALARSSRGLAEDAAIGAELAAHLRAVAPIYRTRLWPEHERANIDWTNRVADRLEELGPVVIPRIVELLETEWITERATVHVVYYGRAYTTDDPPVTVIAASDDAYLDWAGAEMVSHEVGHTIAGALRRRIQCEATARNVRPGELWHASFFYVTGQAWRQELARRGIEYSPYAYAAGLFTTGIWSRYREPLETHLGPYVGGAAPVAPAYAALVATTESSADVTAHC